MRVTLGGPAADKRSRLIRAQCFKNSDLEWRHIYLLNYECDTAHNRASHWQKGKKYACEMPPQRVLYVCPSATFGN
jgi:hypothetical protein